MKRFCGIMAGVATCVLLFGIFLQCLFSSSYSMAFFAEEFEKNGTVEATGIEKSDLMDIARVLVDYLRGEREDIVVRANVRGAAREIFNERETLHMIDVRLLYDLARNVRLIAFIAGVLMLAVALLLSGDNIHGVFGGIFFGTVAFLIVLGGFALYVALDFYNAFTAFHHLLFTNDLWLLDPRTDILIQMLPAGFFMDIALRIALSFLGIAVIAGGAGFLLWRRLREHWADA